MLRTEYICSGRVRLTENCHQREDIRLNFCLGIGFFLYRILLRIVEVRSFLIFRRSDSFYRGLQVKAQELFFLFFLFYRCLNEFFKPASGGIVQED